MEIIGPDVFINCTNLEEVVLGENVKEIQESAFVNTAIKEIVLPASVTKIKRGSFGTYSLKSVTVTANLSDIENGSFVGGDGFVIYGPAGCAAETYANEKGYNYVVE